MQVLAEFEITRLVAENLIGARGVQNGIARRKRHRQEVVGTLRLKAACLNARTGLIQVGRSQGANHAAGLPAFKVDLFAVLGKFGSERHALEPEELRLALEVLVEEKLEAAAAGQHAHERALCHIRRDVGKGLFHREVRQGDENDIGILCRKGLIAGYAIGLQRVGELAFPIVAGDDARKTFGATC